MAKLVSLFNTFLSEINPDSKATEYAVEAHTRVRECLENSDDKFGETVTGTFLYGSYRRVTAVDTIKDVDVVVITDIDINDEDNEPNKVLRRLKASLKKCYGTADFLEYQRRSIRVDDPIPDYEDAELTLDVIPAVIVSDKDSPLMVPDREQKEWISTHPKGHITKTHERNSEDYSSGRYVPLVKMTKWWWKYQCEARQPDVERPKPKGFWVECLVGECFDPQQESYAEHFVALLQAVVDQYGNPTEVPTLIDPGLPDQVIKTNMELAEFEVFMTAIEESLDLAQKALDEEDKLKSSELWREVFGERFPLYDEEETEETRQSSKNLDLTDVSHVATPPWPIKLAKKYKVRLDAYIYRGNSRLGAINSNGRILPSGMELKYIASIRNNDIVEVWWQVVNTGKHASLRGGLRGNFFKAKLLNSNRSSNPYINWERTEYTGKHWIECFIVKDKICVGRSGRFYVNVRNPNY